MPMATSMKKVENPVVQISPICFQRRDGLTRRRVFFLEKKWVIITTKVMAEPMAVASPAPKIPYHR